MWAGGALKRHARNSDAEAGITVLSVSSVVLVDRSVLVRFGRSSWLKNWAYDRHMIFEASPPGYAVLRMVYRRGRGCCPGRCSLRFTFYLLGRSHRQSPNCRRIASTTLAQSEQAVLSWTNSEIWF